MKKILSLVLIVAAVGAVAAVNVRWNDEPDYIQAAETRVGSYLTSDYGRVTCNSARVNAQRWELGCVNKAKGKISSLRSILPTKLRTGFHVRSTLKRLMMTLKTAPATA
jgi:hypothetical protein